MPSMLRFTCNMTVYIMGSCPHAHCIALLCCIHGMALTARRARRPPARRPPPPRKRAPLPCPPPSRAQEMPLPAATRSTSRRERGLCARQPPTRPSPSPHRQASTVWWLVQAAAGPVSAAARCVACRQIHCVVFSTARDLHSVPAQRSLS